MDTVKMERPRNFLKNNLTTTKKILQVHEESQLKSTKAMEVMLKRDYISSLIKRIKKD